MSTPPPQPTAQYILERWRAVSHVAAAHAPSTSSALYRLRQQGRETTILVLAKAPNKILLRTEYPWMDRVLYKGYDGRTAWQSTNLGDAGPLTGYDAQVVKMQAEEFNSAGLFPKRWPSAVTRLADVTVLDRSYYVLQFRAPGAAPLVRLYDKTSFKGTGQIEPDGTVDICSDSDCRISYIVRGGKVAGTTERLPAPQQQIDDIQFEPPRTPHDSTANWLLDRYRAALGPYTGYSFRGTIEMIDNYGKRYHTTYAMAAQPPLMYTRTLFYPKGQWIERFDGKTGTIQNVDARIVPDRFAQLYAFAYNHCMLNADICGLAVTRQPNQLIDGRVYYVLGARSKTDPSVWFSVGLDPQTFLPAFADFDAGRLVFSDYVRTAAGLAYPRTCHEIDFNGDIRSTVKLVDAR